ncbi:MAG TPA: 2-oxoglutarate and iron-dependent oxygenase domain-containing protein [Candidatus Limnocylindria bacterium]|nr:2-oxoglutarate and iron-dependent oxygenase domain-containing protein [Candidatus Limnocylindria bacterium]
MQEFPVVDLSAFPRAPLAHGAAAGTALSEKQALARRVGEVCRQTGFLAVVGHGVPDEIVSGAWDAARRFFDLPMEKKLEVKMPYVGYPYGYSPLQAEALAKSLGEETPPDLKESFSIGPLEHCPHKGDEPDADFRFAANLWPKEPANFRAAWSAYYRAMSALAAWIMRVFALALELPEGFFDGMIDNPISAMRALNYPHQSAAPKPGQLRAGAHSDYGSLTILLAEAAPGGLEIFTPEGKWQAVPVVPGAFVVNIGDLMARWTNDRWVSTLHRVVNPSPDARGSTRRQSVAFFHQPNWDAEISCIPTCLAPGEKAKYPPVGSGAHLMGKFHSTVKLGTAAAKGPA